ncbi:hypothetical protein AVEN_141499-1 [Araneus ventricosus]|uniref:ATP-dependent DNA helicase n=1 Tax=Araneus ventricosus TaxID=182803 RepID=A0A4Y2LVC8_ARAVE|nr:hypothetical protein AVEN_141499-1 [Araneus ventricosus]
MIKIRLPEILNKPEILKDLLTSDSLESKSYRKHIREYNSALNFASMGAQIKPSPGTKPYSYRIYCQIYHVVSPLYSNHNKPGYCQLYVFYTSKATEKRMERNEVCLPSVMEILDSMLRAINPFIECYLQMHRIIEGNPTSNIRIVFMENGDLDLRRYNQPTFRAEIAAIFVGDNGEPPANRDICIYPADDIMKRNLFGRVISYIYVIEFQKRGLPQAHNLLTLDTYSKIRIEDDIDKYLSAQLPDPISDPTFFQIITICMIYGPCGTLNPNSPCMREGGQEEEAFARTATIQTTLTAWVELNKNDQDSHNYFYTDIPHYYTFNKSAMKWQKLQRGGEQVIGRMPVVNMQDSEKYYLRLLLLRKLGPVSFDVLKTVDGIVSNTFSRHVKCKDYLRDINIATTHLRLLFATICGFGGVNDIPELWFRYKDALSEYFVRQYYEDSGPQYALAEIEEFFKHYNSNLKKLKLSTVHLPDALSNLPSSDILEEQQKGQINARKLNEEQKLVFHIILKTIYDNKEDTSRLFFLDGPAGTGKTFLYNTLLHTTRGKGHHVTPVASSGIAATLLNGGRTAHSVFKIPIVLNATSTCNVEPNA